uniref:Uncharacterized protein n=1 Tax=Dunaliella tertiolecta TaxID=3047 RepID=A0A7S3R8B6_DUNTE
MKGSRCVCVFVCVGVWVCDRAFTPHVYSLMLGCQVISLPLVNPIWLFIIECSNTLIVLCLWTLDCKQLMFPRKGCKRLPLKRALCSALELSVSVICLSNT